MGDTPTKRSIAHLSIQAILSNKNNEQKTYMSNITH